MGPSKHRQRGRDQRIAEFLHQCLTNVGLSSQFAISGRNVKAHVAGTEERNSADTARLRSPQESVCATRRCRRGTFLTL